MSIEHSCIRDRDFIQKWNRQKKRTNHNIQNGSSVVFFLPLSSINICMRCAYINCLVAIELNWNELNRTASTNESSQIEKKTETKGFFSFIFFTYKNKFVSINSSIVLFIAFAVVLNAVFVHFKPLERFMQIV